MRNPEIVIIGDGIAGITAARHIRRLNRKARVTLIGSENVPLYSACALPDYLHGYQSRESVFVLHFPELRGVKMIKGTKVNSINRETQHVSYGAEEIYYDRLIIATGSNPFIPPVPGAKLPGNFTLKTLEDVEKIMEWGGESAVVIGSGAIGVETSMALLSRGLKVTLIEMLDRIMPTAFDATASQILQTSLENLGIKVYVGEKVLGVEGTTEVRGVMSTLGSIDSDIVIWAAGVRPNTALAQEAGIETGGLRGIKVNDRMQTNDPQIFACGDCIETWEQVLRRPTLSLLWASAKEQAEVAAWNVLGMEKRYRGALGVMIEQIGGNLSVAAGYTESSLKEIQYKVHEGKSAKGYYKVIYTEEKVLGVQFVGDPLGSGATVALIKKGSSPESIIHLLEDTESLKCAPWTYSAARIFNFKESMG